MLLIPPLEGVAAQASWAVCVRPVLGVYNQRGRSDPWEESHQVTHARYITLEPLFPHVLCLFDSQWGTSANYATEREEKGRTVTHLRTGFVWGQVGNITSRLWKGLASLEINSIDRNHRDPEIRSLHSIFLFSPYAQRSKNRYISSAHVHRKENWASESTSCNKLLCLGNISSGSGAVLYADDFHQSL